MKKLILILFIGVIIQILIIVSGCSGNQNRGYGYNTKTEIPEQTTTPETNPQKKESWFEKSERQYESRTVKLYNTDDEYMGRLYTYKCTYDGQEFYVFKDTDGDGMAVVPSAMCKYYEKLLKNE